MKELPVAASNDGSCMSLSTQTNEPLVALVRKLGIKGDGDVARIMHVFLDVDVRGTHKLDIETFFEYFDIELTEYNKRAFQRLAFGQHQVPYTTLFVVPNYSITTAMLAAHSMLPIINCCPVVAMC